ncbi:hypothetical protein BC941DRAFT_442591 [Chlamydoabsidia padenii]|nr:hypothetical protein BC941DRAFT_442591 [Chlamydoabsidia padenii]
MTTPDLETDAGLDKYFSQSEKYLEIDRVLASFKLDPFCILQLPYGTPDPKSVKMAYRKKSLQIHPDKVDHPQAQEAFAKLKKAETDLGDATQLSLLLDLIQEAKVDMLKEKGEKIKMKATTGNVPSVVDDDLYPYLSTEQGQRDIQTRLKQLLIELELRRRRLMKKDMESEGAEARKVELAAKERKRKAEEQKEWENTRETRVNSWRDFQKKGAKKKKVKKSTA